MEGDPARTGGRSAIAARRTRAVESFGNAADALGRLDFGASVFAVTRGQWSMIDAILHTLDCCRGLCRMSVWTWTVAEYEVEVLGRLRVDGRVTDGRLVIDIAARNKNAGIIAEWRERFGPSSVRFVVNHAKIATVEDAEGRRFLLRGSMNLNFNPRFENFDITEGGPEFALVRRMEEELPPTVASVAEAHKASRTSSAFDPGTLALFQGVKAWKPQPK